MQLQHSIPILLVRWLLQDYRALVSAEDSVCLLQTGIALSESKKKLSSGEDHPVLAKSPTAALEHAVPLAENGSAKALVISLENSSAEADIDSVETNASGDLLSRSRQEDISSRVNSTVLHANASLLGKPQVEIELAQAAPSAPVKSKLVLVILQVLLFPNCLGLDRCYMNQLRAGLIKATTLGGLGVWSIFDFVVIMSNALQRSADLHMLGFEATWSEGTVQPAYHVSYWMLVFLGVLLSIAVIIHTYQILNDRWKRHYVEYTPHYETRRAMSTSTRYLPPTSNVHYVR